MVTGPDDSFSTDLSLGYCSFSLAIFLMNDIFLLIFKSYAATKGEQALSTIN